MLELATLVTSLFSLYLLPVGRRIYAMLEIKRRAEAAGLTDVVAHATRSIAHDNEVLEMQARYRKQRESQYGPEARTHDLIVDRLLGAIDDYLRGQIRAYDPGHVRGRAARLLHGRLFPDSLGAITKLSYAEEHVYVANVLTALIDEPELAEALSVLADLVLLIDELRLANQAYGEALGGADAGVLSPTEMRSAQAHGQQLLAEVVALVLAHFAIHAPDDLDGRRHLIQPLLAQQRALTLLRRRRRRPGDIDPETGEDLPEDEGPGESPIEDEIPAELTA